MTGRSEYAGQALKHYCHSKNEPFDTLETGIIDLLTDLLHLARAEGLDGFQLSRIAAQHFLVEKETALIQHER